MNQDITRRSLIKTGLFLSLASTFFCKVGRASPTPPKDLIKETDPLAMGLKYSHDTSTVAPALKKKKMGVEGKDQNCINCMQYKKTGDLGGEEVGTCKIFASGLVKGKGWCVSWAKKAGT